MRQIKFRGKSIFNGGWVYGLPRFRNGLDHGIIEEENGMGHDVEKETVTQFTGLLDKKGKEIYEGDIVDFTDDFDEENKGVIKYSDKYITFYIFDQHNDWCLIKDCPEDMTLEVIGNIYENPELLVDKKNENNNEQATV